MTAAVTPKGERRRYALIAAAAELLCEGGFDAVRHRSVARRAGLPLAATTYYFSSLEDLVVQAVEYTGAQEAAQLHARLARISRRRRGVEATADVFVGCCWVTAPPRRSARSWSRDTSGTSHVLGIRGCVTPSAGSVRQRTAAVIEAIERCGRTVRRDRIKALICAIDGAVVAALVEDGGNLRATATAALIDVIDVLAPLR